MKDNITDKLWEHGHVWQGMPSRQLMDNAIQVINDLRKEIELLKNNRLEVNKKYLKLYDELKSQKEYYGILWEKFDLKCKFINDLYECRYEPDKLLIMLERNKLEERFKDRKVTTDSPDSYFNPSTDE